MLRNRILSLHGLVGILGGLLLVVMDLTGNAIVFHQKSERPQASTGTSSTPGRTNID